VSDPFCPCTVGRIALLAAYMHSSLNRTFSLPRHQEIESTVGECPARPMFHHFNSLSSANSRLHALYFGGAQEKFPEKKVTLQKSCARPANKAHFTLKLARR